MCRPPDSPDRTLKPSRPGASVRKVRVRPQIDYRWERGLWELDRKGETPTGRPTQVSQMDYALLYQEAGRREAATGGREVLGATLDVNAIMVSSGQSIWFYRGTRVEPVSAQDLVEFRALRAKDGWRFQPVANAPPDSPAAPLPPQPTSVVTHTVGAAPASPEDQRYHQLMLELVRDFAQRFSGRGLAAGSPAGAPPPAPVAPAPQVQQPGQPAPPGVPAH